MICSICNKRVEFDDGDYVKTVSSDPRKNRFFHFACFDGTAHPNDASVDPASMVDNKLAKNFLAM